MIEILSHQYLKKFMRTQKLNWEHAYSFGRIISKSIQNNSTYLINSEIFFTKEWLTPVLISLFLKQENSIFVLTNEKIEFIKNTELERLKKIGFHFILKKNQIIFPNHQVSLITIKNLLEANSSLKINNRLIVFRD